MSSKRNGKCKAGASWIRIKFLNCRSKHQSEWNFLEGIPLKYTQVVALFLLSHSPSQNKPKEKERKGKPLEKQFRGWNCLNCRLVWSFFFLAFVKFKLDAFLYIKFTLSLPFFSCFCELIRCLSMNSVYFIFSLLFVGNALFFYE